MSNNELKENLIGNRLKHDALKNVYHGSMDLLALNPDMEWRFEKVKLQVKDSPARTGDGVDGGWCFFSPVPVTTWNADPNTFNPMDLANHEHIWSLVRKHLDLISEHDFSWCFFP